MAKNLKLKTQNNLSPPATTYKMDAFAKLSKIYYMLLRLSDKFKFSFTPTIHSRTKN